MSESSRSRRLEELFHACADLPPDEQRAAVSELAQQDAELSAQLARLLHTDARRDNPLDDPRRVLFGAQQGSPDASWEGREIGRYRLLRVLASGGMGVVFEAEQQDPRRSVALKLMRVALAGESARRRFRYEAEVLGRLSHAHIAQVLEAGLHNEGSLELPYFALEFVRDAETLLAHATRRELSVAAGLELFGKVCEAVHHGHLNGVIHRDLKPDNLLVDADGQPKVIDFGVACATDADVARTTMHTGVGELVGTLQYMSPEQTLADPASLDARTDVYSLGVVLYELLCGAPPYDLHGVTLVEAARVIRDVAPPRPSTHRAELSVDLEAITLKCLEKEPARRYASAADLARDLAAFAASRPVEARVPGLARHLLLFSRRHRAVAWLGSALLLALVAGTLISAHYALEAGDEREAALAAGAEALAQGDAAVQASAEALAQRDAARAAERAEFAARREAEELTAILTDAWQAITPDRARTADTALLEAVLERAAARADAGLIELPSVEAPIRSLIARVLYAVGRAENALPHARRSLELARSLHGEADPATLYEMTTLGSILGALGEADESAHLLRAVLDARVAAEGPQGASALGARRDLAAHYLASGRPADAERELRLVHAATRDTLSADDVLELVTVNDLARVVAELGDTQAAGALLEEILPRARALLGDDHPETLRAWHDLAGVFLARGELERAADAFAATLPVVRAVFGAASLNHATNQESLALLRSLQGRPEDALVQLSGAIQSRHDMSGGSDPKILENLAGVVTLLSELGEGERAVLVARELLDRATQHLGPTSPEAGFARDYLAAHDSQP